MHDLRNVTRPDAYLARQIVLLVQHSGVVWCVQCIFSASVTATHQPTSRLGFALTAERIPAKVMDEHSLVARRYPGYLYRLSGGRSTETRLLTSHKAYLRFLGICDDWTYACREREMDVGGWIEQNQPSPRFEYEQVVVAPASAMEAPPDLDAMAQELDHMKIEAAIDAERTRAGLNGFFAFILTTPLIYIVAYAAEYREKSFDALAHPQHLLEPLQAAIALGGGLALASAVAIASHIATRKHQARVQVFQEKLISLGGTPLPERGQPLHTRHSKTAHDAS